MKPLVRVILIGLLAMTMCLLVVVWLDVRGKASRGLDFEGILLALVAGSVTSTGAQ